MLVYVRFIPIGKIMSDELLSIVDNNDEVIGTKPRSEVHSQGLIHRAVHILVFNDQRQLFLQKRSMNKDENPGLWDTSAAGHVDAGESYEMCAAREIYEELGIKTNEKLKYLFKLPASEQTGMEFIEVYRCNDNGPFTMASEEIDEGKWFSLTVISKLVENNDILLTDSFKTLWRRFEAETI